MSDIPELDTVNPVQLRLLLERVGWEVVGSREDSFVRLRQNPQAYGSLLIPLNRGYSDFDDLLRGVLLELSTNYADIWSRNILPEIAIVRSDSVRFRKETSAPRGMISWKTGESLVDTSSATLAAGAKAHRDHSRYFGNRFGKFAARYLESILMGQTEIGSYIVTAYVPADARVPFSNSKNAPLEAENLDASTGRSITGSLLLALQATRSALDSFKANRSMSEFEAAVDLGVSYELTKALAALTDGSEGADIAIEWGGSASPDRPNASFEFSPADSPVLSSASALLSSPPEIHSYVAVGRVHLLTKKDAEGPGVVGIDDGHRKYRVRLASESQYHDAVLAHDEKRQIEVRGQLSREGTINWLYDARIIRTLPTEDLPLFDS